MTTGLDMPKKPVVAVQRAVQVLRYLGAASNPAGVNEIARALDLVPSTCLHILKTLAHEGMVTADTLSKKYRLGPTLLRLARDMVGTNDFVRMAQPLLERMAAAHGATTAAVWLEGRERVIVVATASSRTDFGIQVSVGSRFPALISAIGACVVATSEIPKQDLQRRFKELKWQKAPAFETWLDDIDRARRDGFAVDRGHYIGGITVVAAPVFQADGSCSSLIAGLGLTAQFRERTLEALIGEVRRTAGTLSARYDDGGL